MGECRAQLALTTSPLYVKHFLQPNGVVGKGGYPGGRRAEGRAKSSSRVKVGGCRAQLP